MLRYAYEPGDKVKWPMTSVAAEENEERCLTVLDTIQTRYESGKFYIKYLYDGLGDRIIEDMQQNYEEEFDNLVVVVGPEGSGKSNLALDIAKRYDPDFDMEKSLIYHWVTFLESVTGDDPQRVYWFDEAVMVAAGRNWQNDENKMLFEALQFIRSMKLTLIMCIPSFDNIDVYIRMFRTRYLIKAQLMAWSKDQKAERGYAELKTPLPEGKRKSLPKDSKAEDYFETKGYFKFPKMSAEDKETYDALKLKHQKEKLVVMLNKIRSQDGSKVTRDKRSLSMLIGYLANEQGMSYKDIAQIAGMPYNTVKGMAWRERNATGDDME